MYLPSESFGDRQQITTGSKAKIEELKLIEQDPLLNINSLFAELDDKEQGLRSYLSILKDQVVQLNSMISDIENIKDAPQKLVNHKIDIIKKKEEINKLEADNKILQSNLEQYQLETDNKAELTSYEEKQLEIQLKNAHHRFIVMEKRIINNKLKETEKYENKINFISNENLGIRESLINFSKLKKELLKKFKEEIDNRGFNSQTYFDILSKNNKLQNKLNFIKQDLFKYKSALNFYELFFFYWVL